VTVSDWYVCIQLQMCGIGSISYAVRRWLITQWSTVSTGVWKGCGLKPYTTLITSEFSLIMFTSAHDRHNLEHTPVDLLSCELDMHMQLSGSACVECL
jgi:hypothetical protein